MPDDLQPLGGNNQIGNLVPELGGRGLPPSLQILLNEGLYERVKQLAGVMARAQGFTPTHLIGKAEACFSVIMMSLDWKLSPPFVARHTYQTPGGQIGYDGALVQAIMEQSGRFIGSPSFEFRGDWQKLTGKFEVKTGQRGGSFVSPTWTAADAVGLGIIVRWTVRGEQAPRVWPGENEPFWLTQCYPLNSPLWATDPKTQISYLAIRRFGNLTSPGIIGAASFDHDELLDASERAINITEPRREDFTQQSEPEPEPEPEPQFAVIDLDGVEHAYLTAEGAEKALTLVLRQAAERGLAGIAGAWESNAVVEQMPPDMIGRMSQLHAELRADCIAREKAAVAEQEAARAREAAEAKPAAPAAGKAASAPPADPTAPATAAPASDLLGKEPERTVPRYTAPSTAEPAKVPDPPSVLTGTAAASPAAGVPAYEERKSLEIAPVMDRGKEDWRSWWIALFVPKMRQATGDVLPWLLGDNEANLDKARKALGAADINAAIKAKWTEIG